MSAPTTLALTWGMFHPQPSVLEGDGGVTARAREDVSAPETQEGIWRASLVDVLRKKNTAGSPLPWSATFQRQQEAFDADADDERPNSPRSTRPPGHRCKPGSRSSSCS